MSMYSNPSIDLKGKRPARSINARRETGTHRVRMWCWAKRLGRASSTSWRSFGVDRLVESRPWRIRCRWPLAVAILSGGCLCKRLGVNPGMPVRNCFVLAFSRVVVGGDPIVATPKRTWSACVWDLITMLATSVKPVGAEGRLTIYRPVVWSLRPRKMVWPSALSPYRFAVEMGCAVVVTELADGE